MSEQEYRIEKCGGLTVYHPIKKQEQPEVGWLRPEFIAQWNAIVNGLEQIENPRRDLAA